MATERNGLYNLVNSNGENSEGAEAETTTATTVTVNRSESCWSKCWKWIGENPVFFLCLCILSVLAIVCFALHMNPRAVPCKEDPCPRDWIRHKGHCLYLSNDRLTWNQSLEFCASNNSALIQLDSQEKKNAIERLMESGRPHWGGLRKTGGKWQWLDDSELNETVKDDGESRDCGLFEFTIRGRDSLTPRQSAFYALDCQTQRHFTCEKTML